MPRVLVFRWISAVLLAAVSCWSQPINGADRTGLFLAQSEPDKYAPSPRGHPQNTIGAVSRDTLVAERRIALVIGNSAYQTLRLQLDNPEKDARDIASALAAAGFQITVETNVRRRELYRLIDAFGEKIAATPDTVGLFYYAGHGIQRDGRNYLIPIDADLTSEAELEAEAVDTGKVLRAMDAAQNPLNIVILDACRDNPLPRKARSLIRGLARMEAPRGTFIAYAAAPGQTAADGDKGGNGVFTGALIKQLVEPGLPIEEVFKRVIRAVSQRTGGRQVPWMESSLQGDFYFIRPMPVVAPPPIPPDPELVFWQTIAKSANAADFEEYLRRYPEGQFVGLAKNRVAALRAPKPPPPARRPGATGSHLPEQRAPAASAPATAPPQTPPSPGAKCFTFQGKQFCE